MKKTNGRTKITWRLVILSLAFFVSANVLPASILSYEGLTGDVVLIENGYGGGLNPTPFYSAPVKGRVFATLDTDALSMTFSRLEINSSAAQSTFTSNFTTGFGTSANITTTINYDPFSMTVTDMGPYALTASSGGNFILNGPLQPVSLTFSGSYTMSDGSDTRTGTFAQTVDAYFRMGGTLDTNEYPGTLVLSRSGSPPFSSTGQYATVNLFSETYGAATVNVNLNQAIIQSGSYITLNQVSAIPESGTWPLMAGIGVFCATIVSRRRSRLVTPAGKNDSKTNAASHASTEISAI